jgi:hypothetical protein
VEFYVEFDPNDPFKNIMKTRMEKCEIYEYSRVISHDITTELDVTKKLVFDDKFIRPSVI